MKFFRIPFNSDDDSGTTEARSNRLQKYIHGQSVQDMSRLATEISPDVRQLIGANVQALLGYLPASEFSTTVMASKESLQNLLASAMLTGFFMHAMETRMQMDALFEGKPHAPAPELQHPETLFATPEAVLDPEDLSDDTSFAQEPGRFLSAQELEADNDPSDELNIQLEISTRMNRAELARLLKELREFQDRQEPEGEG
ncbi:MAG TPA: DUF760 domain-containing protein [Candidatus Obscuribacterales bacterium]